MANNIKSWISPLKNFIVELKKYTSDRPNVTDLISKLIITFGVVLIVGGLYLMIIASGLSGKSSSSATELAIGVINWIPGVPFYIGDLASSGVTLIGIVSWIMGVDLLLIGLGCWVRHRIARIISFAIFFLAACFQGIQLLYMGVLISPASLVVLCVDLTLAYFVFSRFDSQSLSNVKTTS